MELGETGKPVPGWMLTLNRIDRKLLRTQPDTFFTTETVMEKGRGRVAKCRHSSVGSAESQLRSG